MTKAKKVLYLLITTIFFVVFNLCFSDLILNDFRFKMTENPFLDLIFVQNTGAAFSILENSKIFLILFSLIAILLILNYVIKNLEKLTTFAVFWASMLISGVGCNLYERITFGYVRDFFKLNFIEFPVFNISDIFINVSVIALIVIIIKNKYLRNENKN